MTMNIQGLNTENGHHPSTEVLLPPAGDTAIFDPSAISAIANQLYTALPNQSSITTPPQTGVGELGSGSNFIPIENPKSQIPNSVASGPTISEEALTEMAKQLSAQMLPGNHECLLKKAFAELQPVASFPESTPAFPTTTVSPSSDAFNLEALSKVAQELYAQIPPISAIGTPIESVSKPPKPTSILPVGEVDLQRAIADANSQANHSTIRETPESSFSFLSYPTVPKLGLQSGEPFDVNVIRKDFPILHQQVHGKPLIWLDNAATTQKPQNVIDALSLYYQRDNSNIHRAAHTLAARATDAYEAAREKVQRFLGASSASEIVFVRGTTEAINLVAQTYGRKYIREGDEIILSTLEHHANIVPWQMLAQETGAILKVIPVTDSGEIILEEYTRLLGPRTRLVSITQVSNALGTVLPVREMTEMAHRHNARVLIDGAQAVSHQAVNVQDLNCDFYTFSGHKVFAPTGIGVLYAKREILEDLPPWQGGGSMIRHVTFERTIYSDPPAKFEAGTPNIADAVGLGAAIDYITRLGMINIEQYEHKLTEYGMQRLAEIPGLRLIGTAPHKVSVLSFILDDIPVEQVGQRLAQEGIAVRAGHHCAQPTMQRYGLTGTVRPSLAFYNTREEIDTLVEVLHSIRFR